jgi:hypothetical protein
VSPPSNQHLSLVARMTVPQKTRPVQRTIQAAFVQHPRKNGSPQPSNSQAFARRTPDNARARDAARDAAHFATMV